MKKLFSIGSLMLIVLMGVTMSGCGNNSNELKWNAALQQQIKQDYVNSSFRQDADTISAVVIHAYYGIYGDSVALIINGNSGYADIEVSETVAEKTFFYGNPGLAILVWNDGEFYTLTQAFDQDLLTAANIETISTLHQE